MRIFLLLLLPLVAFSLPPDPPVAPSPAEIEEAAVKAASLAGQEASQSSYEAGKLAGAAAATIAAQAAVGAVLGDSVVQGGIAGGTQSGKEAGLIGGYSAAISDASVAGIIAGGSLGSELGKAVGKDVATEVAQEHGTNIGTNIGQGQGQTIGTEVGAMFGQIAGAEAGSKSGAIAGKDAAEQYVNHAEFPGQHVGIDATGENAVIAAAVNAALQGVKNNSLAEQIGESVATDAVGTAAQSSIDEHIATHTDDALNIGLAAGKQQAQANAPGIGEANGTMAAKTVTEQLAPQAAFEAGYQAALKYRNDVAQGAAAAGAQIGVTDGLGAALQGAADKGYAVGQEAALNTDPMIAFQAGFEAGKSSAAKSAGDSAFEAAYKRAYQANGDAGASAAVEGAWQGGFAAGQKVAHEFDYSSLQATAEATSALTDIGASAGAAAGANAGAREGERAGIAAAKITAVLHGASEADKAARPAAAAVAPDEALLVGGPLATAAGTEAGTKAAKEAAASAAFASGYANASQVALAIATDAAVHAAQQSVVAPAVARAVTVATTDGKAIGSPLGAESGKLAGEKAGWDMGRLQAEVVREELHAADGADQSHVQAYLAANGFDALHPTAQEDLALLNETFVSPFTKPAVAAALDLGRVLGGVAGKDLSNLHGPSIVATEAQLHGRVVGEAFAQVGAIDAAEKSGLIGGALGGRDAGSQAGAESAAKSAHPAAIVAADKAARKVTAAATKKIAFGPAFDEAKKTAAAVGAAVGAAIGDDDGAKSAYEVGYKLGHETGESIANAVAYGAAYDVAAAVGIAAGTKEGVKYGALYGASGAWDKIIQEDPAHIQVLLHENDSDMDDLQERLGTLKELLNSKGLASMGTRTYMLSELEMIAKQVNAMKRSLRMRITPMDPAALKRRKKMEEIEASLASLTHYHGQQEHNHAHPHPPQTGLIEDSMQKNTEVSAASFRQKQAMRQHTQLHRPTITPEKKRIRPVLVDHLPAVASIVTSKVSGSLGTSDISAPRLSQGRKSKLRTRGDLSPEPQVLLDVSEPLHKKPRPPAWLTDAEQYVSPILID